jgi:hypothetical protein
MSDIPEHIQIKLENAEDFIPRIMKLCSREATYPRAKQINKISVGLGEMAHTLRSALNNAIWDFAKTHLKARVAEDEYEKIRYSHDFPIEKDKESFSSTRSRIMRHVVNDYTEIYEFLEQAQPYHEKVKNLWYLKILSNYTTHTIPVKPQVLRANDISLGGIKPRIIGGKVIIPGPNGSPDIINQAIPCYIEELKMFVSKKKKWVVFLIDVEEKTKPNLVPFMHNCSQRVSQIISEFYGLW